MKSAVTTMLVMPALCIYTSQPLYKFTAIVISLSEIQNAHWLKASHVTRNDTQLSNLIIELKTD